MGKRYSKQEREETLKLAQEIGAAAASRRLGVNVDTIYTWQSKERNRDVETSSPMGEEVRDQEIETLHKKLREREEEIEILQDALGFFVVRRKK